MSFVSALDLELIRTRFEPRVYSRKVVLGFSSWVCSAHLGRFAPQDCSEELWLTRRVKDELRDNLMVQLQETVIPQFSRESFEDPVAFVQELRKVGVCCESTSAMMT